MCEKDGNECEISRSYCMTKAG